MEWHPESRRIFLTSGRLLKLDIWYRTWRRKEGEGREGGCGWCAWCGGGGIEVKEKEEEDNDDDDDDEMEKEEVPPSLIALRQGSTKIISSRTDGLSEPTLPELKMVLHNLAPKKGHGIFLVYSVPFNTCM